MKALIIYDTLFGNTKAIAEAVSVALSEQYESTTRFVGDSRELSDDVDLLVIGGPTHRHGLSDGMRDLLERVPAGRLPDLRFAAFDTRYRGPGWITGSAAKVIARQLRGHGARQVIAPESFFVARDRSNEGEKRNHERERLEAGETERATAWGRQIANLLVPVA